MKSIKKIEAFQCPVCDATHDSKTKATECMENCEKEAAKEKKYLEKKAHWQESMNEFRLELDSIQELPKLLTAHIAKHFNAIVNIDASKLRFGEVSCSHSSPIGKPTVWSSLNNPKNLPTRYLGWQGNISGKTLKQGKAIDGYDRSRCSLSDFCSDGFNNGIQGIHTGTGSGSHTGTWQYEFRIFLMDFPKLQLKYEQYLELQEKEKKYIEQEQKQASKVDALFNELLEKDHVNVNEVERELVEAEEKLKQFRDKKTKLLSKHFSEAAKKRHTDFAISKKYEFDRETLLKFNHMFRRDY